ncbi:MAG: ferredoxin domain-containing protein [Bacteroidales bacterium]
MAIEYRNKTNHEQVKQVAEEMAIAARTAPKTRGKDVIHTAIVDGEEKEALAKDMKRIAEKYDMAFFARDAENLMEASCVLLLGNEIRVNNLNPCGMCGFLDCEEKQKHPEVPCVFNPMDLGIALGSAISVAANARVDNRIMYTVGQAAICLEYFDANVKVVCGIPLNVSGKNIFFDRKKKK